ncbi:MAG: hypothetical protein WBJ13_11365, partial [Sedimentibacter sp.]
MTLTFKTKDNPSKIDTETVELAEFIIHNTKYIEITFAVLSRKKIPASNIIKNIKASPEIDTVDNDKNFIAFCKLMSSFYSTSSDVIKDRRGYLLELIVRTIKPINDEIYLAIPESLVFYNGVKMSRCDIDVVLQYSEYDLIECKADVESYLYVPLAKKKKNKLRFMENVRQLATDERINCKAYLATYGSEEMNGRKASGVDEITKAMYEENL